MKEEYSIEELEEIVYQHKESANEDFYECMNDYLDGTMLSSIY